MARNTRIGQKSQPFADLESCLKSRTAAEAVSANCALLSAFTDILHSLIGVELTRRILNLAWWGAVGIRPQPDRGHSGQR